MKLDFYMWFCKFIQPFQVVMVSMPKVIQRDWTNVPLRLAIERQKFVTFLRVCCMKTWTGKNVNYVQSVQRVQSCKEAETTFKTFLDRNETKYSRMDLANFFKGYLS